MTGFDITRMTFAEQAVRDAADENPRLANWPVVYVLDGKDKLYVGETLNAVKRMQQHVHSGSKRGLDAVQVILDERFNKSVCLDLESYLIRLFDGDGKYKLLNRNEGITDAEYYQRDEYQETFEEIFDALRELELFTHTIPEIENSDLFKLSPYKALNTDQGVAVHDIVERLESDLIADEKSLAVIRGNPGTGKTIVGIYLVKLLRDLAQFDPKDEVNGDSMFSDFFLEGSREEFEGLRIGLVIPQQSLRKSIKKVFRKSPALRGTEILTPFDVGKDKGEFDVLIVDEAHRLTQLAAQAMGTLTKQFKKITKDLFGSLDSDISQLDWIRKKAKHTILLLDSEQKVRPADIDPEQVDAAVDEAKRQHRFYTLEQQMRVRGGESYIRFVRQYFTDHPPAAIPDIGDYDFRLFDDFAQMQDAIKEKEDEVGLSRLVAGYAWRWRSRKDTTAIDIELDGVTMQWNRTPTDWINSSTSIDEMGSIHTVQGYDLNYAGVVIGPDLRVDPATGGLVVDRDNYFDTKGKSNNTMRGRTTTDADLLEYVRNVYRVLMTRGIRGTYVYVVDPLLRERLEHAVQAAR